MPCNVARFLPEAAQTQPEQCAVRLPLPRKPGAEIPYQELTFAELESQSNAAACWLSSQGVARQTRVLLMVKPGRELILLTFALFKMGAVPIVIDPGMGLKNFLKCVSHTQPDVLLGIPLAQAISRVFFRPFASVKKRLSVSPRGLARALGTFAGRDFSIAETQPDELAAILFTSGSTGPPKGVCYEHAMFEAQVAMIREQYQIEPKEVDLPMLPIFALFNPAMGMTTVVPEMNPSRPAAVDPAKIVQAIQQNEVTNSFGSPVLWKKIGRYCESEKITLPSIRRILMAGAPVPPALIEQFKAIIPNGVIHTPYGATESLPVSTLSGPEILERNDVSSAPQAGTCVGRVFPGIEAKIIGITDEAISDWSPQLEIASGEIGEIVVKGPVVTRSYYRLPEATASAKIQEGDDCWHRIGDLGYKDTAGELWFCGRKAERVITGEGLFLTDVCESLINRHPQVFRSALIGLGQPGQQIPAFVLELEAGVDSAKAVAEVRKHAQQFPATAEIEKYFVHPESFPVDVRHNAKIHRLTLKRYYDKKQH